MNTASKSGPSGRRRRVALRIGGSFGIVLIVLSAAVIRPLDRDPWENEAGMSATLDQAQVMHVRVSQGESAPLEAGWAVVPLRLSDDDPLAGYGDRRGAPAERGGEPLHARVLYLRAGSDELCLITADVLLIPPLVSEETARRCLSEGLEPETLFYLATHTHGGPGGWFPHWLGEAVCGPFDEGAVTRLADALTEAVLAARASAQPAEWSWLQTEAPAYVSNRTERGGALDPTLEALAVRHTYGDSMGLMAFYGAHATCYGPDRMTWTGDYPGALVRRLEEAGVKFAAFGAGAVGSQSPVGEGSGEEKAEAIGRALGGQLLEELSSTQWRGVMSLKSERRDLALPRVQVRLSENWRTSDWLALGLHGPVAPFHVARLDEVWLAGVPTEISAMLTTPLREQAETAGKQLCITTFNGDYIGYVLPSSLYDSGAYEAHMNFLGPGGGEFTTEVVRHLTGLEGAPAAGAVR